MWATLLACLLLPALCLSADPDSDGSSSRPLTPQESAQVQNYTRTLSKEWLKNLFDIDIDAIGLSMQRQFGAYTDRQSSSSQPGQPSLSGANALNAPNPYSFHLHLEQVDDFRNITYDHRDIPFAVKMDTDNMLGSTGLDLQTSFFLPLSWKGEMRAAASLPLPGLGPNFVSNLLDTAGFGNRWRVSNIYSNRLGVSSVETGLNTQWLGNWQFGLNNTVRFGQGINENSQWLKLGKTF